MPKATKSSAQVEAQASSQQEANESSQEELTSSDQETDQEVTFNPLDNNHKLCQACSCHK